MRLKKNVRWHVKIRLWSPHLCGYETVTLSASQFPGVWRVYIVTLSGNRQSGPTNPFQISQLPKGTFRYLYRICSNTTHLIGPEWIKKK